MNIPCDDDAVKKSATFYFTLRKVLHWLYTYNPPALQYAREPISPPVCWHSDQCKGCPYPAHGFLCWSEDRSCLWIRMKKLYKKEEVT